MEVDSAQPLTPHRRDRFLLFSNLGLVVFCAVFLFAAFSRYHDRVEEISLSDNRFLATQWSLLQELKSQTDQELIQKDQEIADLSRRYTMLVRTNGSEAELDQLRTRLQQAESERERIASEQSNAVTSANASSTTDTPTSSTPDASPSASGEASGATPPAPGDANAWIQNLLSIRPPLATDSLLQQRLKDLDAQVRVARNETDRLNQQVGELNVQLSQEKTSSRQALADAQAEVDALRASVADLKRAVRAATDKMHGNATESSAAGAITIDDLNTRELVRALIGSPSIHAAYPNLLTDLDKYLADLERSGRMKGESEAYSTDAASLSPILETTPNR